jgi:hypothetical protein
MGEKPDTMKRTRTPRRAVDRGANAVDDVSEIDITDDVNPESVTFGQPDVQAAARADGTTDQIRGDIEETRAQMSGTIDAIQERLSPRRLVNQATETVRDAAVGKVKDLMNNAGESTGGLIDRIKENPIPAALMGLGAYWLFGGSRKVARQPDRFVDALKRHPVPTTLAGLGAVWWLMDRDPHLVYRYAIDDSSLYRSGSPQASRGVRDMAGDTTARRGELAEPTQETVADYTARAQETVGEYTELAQNEFERLLRDNPLALGALSVAVGAAIGMAIPETQREREMIGDISNQVVDKAQDIAQGAIEKVQQVASNLPEAPRSDKS